MSEVYRHGPEGLPPDNRTLAPAVIGWVHQWLQQPDGPDAGEPWRYTPEQARFVAWWYAIDDSGRFVYRRGTLRRMKGWGKDPVLATIAALELCGPCRFSHFDKAGWPVAIPHPAPWIQVAATSKDQTRNTMTLFPGMFGPEAMTEYSVDMGKELIYAHRGRGRIEAVTSSPAALEGGRPSLVIKNENQHWTRSNDGHKMSEVIDRNLAKSRDGAARAMAITNAHEPGLDSDAERDWEAWQKISSGRSRGTGVLYDSLEAPPDTSLQDEESLRAGLEIARGDSYWLDIDRLVEEIYDPKTPPDVSRRFYLNQVWAAQDAWVAKVQWDVLAKDRRVEEGELITLGFDGSKSDDHTALIGCTVEDDHIFPIGIWDPERYGGEAPREDIDLAVRSAMDQYDVVGFYSDLHPWESYVDQWNEDFGHELITKAHTKHAIAWDMRSRGREITVSTERFHDAILEMLISHPADPTLDQHVANARRRPNAWGVAIGKEHRESARKIDGVVAAILARQARLDYLALPESKRRRHQRSGSASFY